MGVNQELASRGEARPRSSCECLEVGERVTCAVLLVGVVKRRAETQNRHRGAPRVEPRVQDASSGRWMIVKTFQVLSPWSDGIRLTLRKVPSHRRVEAGVEEGGTVQGHRHG